MKKSEIWIIAYIYSIICFIIYFGIAIYKDCQFVVEYEDCIDNIDNGNFEVIGIQR